MKQVKLKIKIGRDRENLIIALANAGYKTWLTEDKTKHYNYSGNLSVNLEVNNKDVT